MAELTADTPPTTGAASDGFGTAGYRNYVLMALLIVYIFNFIDRTIVNILTEPIKLSFGLEDWQMGMLGGPAFAVLYTFLGIPIARSAERYNRVIIIATAVAIWSLFTALCGFAMSFLMLFLFRVGVSIGEAGCTPPAQSLIADYFKPSRRATAVSIYALGVPLGGMFASIFGGQLAGLDGSDFGAPGSIASALASCSAVWIGHRSKGGASPLLWSAYRACCCRSLSGEQSRNRRAAIPIRLPYRAWKKPALAKPCACSGESPPIAMSCSVRCWHPLWAMGLASSQRHS